MKDFGTIVKNTVNSLYMKSVTKRKGWSQSTAKDKVVEFILEGKGSLYDFMEKA